MRRVGIVALLLAVPVLAPAVSPAQVHCPVPAIRMGVSAAVDRPWSGPIAYSAICSEPERWQVDVHWGDGTSSAGHLNSSYQYAGAHTYRRAGTYRIEVTLTDLRTGAAERFHIAVAGVTCRVPGVGPGSTVAGARRRLRAAGCLVAPVQRTRSTIRRGRVTGTFPGPGRRTSDLVVPVVSAGRH